MRLASAETFAGRQFHPDSEVLQDQATGQMTFLDVAVLAESDFTRIFKVSSKSLGYKKEHQVNFVNEEGKSQQGFYVGLLLRGLAHAQAGASIVAFFEVVSIILLVSW